MFRSMLAGRSFASIPDLGPTVAKNWRQCIDLCWPADVLPIFLILIEQWPKIGGQCINLCWLASVSICVGLPVSCQYLWSWSVQPWLKMGRPMYQSLLAGLSSAGISDIGPTAPELPAGNMSASQSSASIVLILFKPWHKTSWPMYRSMLGGLSSAGMSDLGPTAAKDCRFFCQYFFFLFSFILV